MDLHPKTFFCHSLRAGTIGVGWLGIIFGFLHLYYCYVVLLANTFIGYVDRTQIVAYSFVFVSSVLMLIVNSLLVYGAKKRLRQFITPWLIWTGAMMAVALFAAISLAFITVSIHISLYHLTGNKAESHLGFLIILIIVPGYALAVYVWLCIYSFRRELEGRSHYPQNSITTTVLPNNEVQVGIALNQIPYVDE